MRKFKTAEEYLALPKEERDSIVDGIIEQGYRVRHTDYIDLQESRELSSKLQDEYNRIEKLAYAIGDEVKTKVQANEGYGGDSLHTLMTCAAEECEQQYCGGYMHHEDGFWVPSTC